MIFRRVFRTKLVAHWDRAGNVTGGCPKCGAQHLTVLHADLSLWASRWDEQSFRFSLYCSEDPDKAFARCGSDLCDARFGFRGGCLVCLNAKEKVQEKRKKEGT